MGRKYHKENATLTFNVFNNDTVLMFTGIDDEEHGMSDKKNNYHRYHCRGRLSVIT